MSDVEPTIQRFLEDRDSLSDEELSWLVRELQARPALAERVKDHLVLEELLAQEFANDRQEFVARFKQRLRKETGSSKSDSTLPLPDEPAEAYPLRWSERPATNGANTHAAQGGDSRSPLEANNRTTQPASPPPIANHERDPARRTALVIFAGLVLAVGGLSWLEFTPAARQIAVIADVTGTAFTYRDGQGYVLAKGWPILPGDRLSLPANTRAVVKFRDQSLLTLHQNTEVLLQPGQENLPGILVVADGKAVFIERGELEAFIKPQPPNRPLIVNTPQLAATVLGTRLRVRVEETQSRLEVIEGRVAVQGPTEREPIELAAGEQAISTNDQLTVSPGAWPVNTEGLVFLLRPEAKRSQTVEEGVRVFAQGRDKAEYVLRPRREAEFSEGKLHFRGGAFLADEQAAADLMAACQQTQELSLELTFQTTTLKQTGPARWVSFSTSPESWNVALAQVGDQCVLYLLTQADDQTLQPHQIPLFRLPDDKPHHVSISYSAGDLRCYLDGQEVLHRSEVTGTFASWTSQRLLFGDEWTGGQAWQGTLEGVALYNRALSAEEARRNALHYRLRFLTDPKDEE